jgi:hypothetical protein
MGADTPAEHLLRRLDADVARAVRERDRLVVAFSGGLASLVLVALVRKRCDVACEVLGLPGSADVEAAAVAEKFLDYPVRVIRPTPAQVLRVACSLATRETGLSTSEVLSVLPLVLLEVRHPDLRIVSGFGLTWDSPRVRSFLPSRSAVFPGLRPREAAPPPRVRLLGVADLLGLPETFSRASRRRPAEGSGVGPALRAAAHAERISLDRLLRVRTPLRENHERRATRVVSKSSAVD